jgi:hypothetical protein
MADPEPVMKCGRCSSVDVKRLFQFAVARAGGPPARTVFNGKASQIDPRRVPSTGGGAILTNCEFHGFSDAGIHSEGGAIIGDNLRFSGPGRAIDTVDTYVDISNLDIS